MVGEYTPGPWFFSFESIDPEWAVVTTSGGRVLANVNADFRQEANALLIAAAPDMLAALEAIMSERWSPAGRSEHVSDMARAAIAKARGED